MAIKVMVTGARGQLGRALTGSAGAAVHCVAQDRAGLDITDADAVERAVAHMKPDLIVNAAAYTAVDKAESEPELARAVNAQGAQNLALACAGHNARLLHVSTDFVFSGEASTPYAPDAPTGPVGEYGRSKLAGEQAVLDACPGALIVRTGWVYSRHGNNFVRTMLRLMAERSEISVVADQVGTPTWATGLARACWAAAQREQLAGIVHWSDAGVCSWYDFAVAIYEEARELGMLDSDVVIQPIATSDYPTPARRPAYSVLDKQDSWRSLQLEGVHWRRQLRAMLLDLRDNGDD